MRLLPAILVALAVFLAGMSMRGPSTASALSCETADISIDAEEARLLALVNDYRVANGVAPLALHDDLVRAATWMATDLTVNPTFGHRDTLGRNAYLRAIDCGYSTGAGENLAAGQSWDTAAEVFAAWKASTGHNANLLSASWVDTGIARVYVYESKWRWYWAIEFGAGEPATAATPTGTAAAADTATPTPTNTPAPASTATPANTPSPTQTNTPTPANTPSPTPTSTPTPANTPSPTPTSTPTAAATVTPTPTPGSNGGTATCGGSEAALDSEEARLAWLINNYRTANGRNALRSNAVLDGIAAWMARDLAGNPVFGHRDTLGRNAYQRAIECGYPGGAGENLAAGSSWDTADEAFRAWQRSSSHNSNMLAAQWTEIGVARVYVAGSKWRWYWVVEFGAGQ